MIQLLITDLQNSLSKQKNSDTQKTSTAESKLLAKLSKINQTERNPATE